MTAETLPTLEDAPERCRWAVFRGRIVTQCPEPSDGQSPFCAEHRVDSNWEPPTEADTDGS